jgi:hypothetical protein
MAHRLLPFDVGAALKLPGTMDTLAERTPPEAAVHRMLSLETTGATTRCFGCCNAAGLRHVG